jgi:drug/metabolite transporter (DMT)-like permease
MATIFWASGFKYASPGRAAIYNQLSTVFIILLARVVLGESLTARRMAGVLLAAFGSILVASG